MPLRLRLLPLLAALLLAPATGAAQASNGELRDLLRLRPGDAVRLEVRDHPELVGEYAVGGDGMVLLPLVGMVAVAGRAFEEVSRDVLAAFGRELVDPVVRLTPVLRIAVLGEVFRPGLIPVDPTYTLADVIAVAGGLTPSADRRAISLMRGGEPVFTVTFDELAGVREPLLSGDQIRIGRRSWIHENVPVVVGGGVSVVATLITALILR